MRYLITFLFMFFPLVFNAIGQEEHRCFIEDVNRVPREHNVDMQHMKLELSFVPEEGLVKGLAEHRFIPLRKTVDTLFLDGPDIDFKEVTMNGKAVPFTADKKGIVIRFENMLSWDKTYSVNIRYEARPEKGLYFIGWNLPDGVETRKQIWSQGQGIDNRYWIPFYDEMNDKLTTELIVTFDSRYEVLSNGLRVKKQKNKDNTTTWHYKMTKPHAPYLVMLGIGDYAIETRKSKSGIPNYLYYYPDQPEKREPTYRFSIEMMDYFEKEIGMPYPWETYAQIPVQDFMYGAMENTTATVFGDFYYVDERAYLDINYVSVNAHELAHQWFGDLVTARSSAHHWLQESFATYYNWLYEREVFGQDHYDWKKRGAAMSSLQASKKDNLPIAHSQAGSTRHYPKGAYVLHMLKYVTSPEEYNKAILHYLKKHAYGNVDSEDLLVAFHETLGMSLDWFWDQWVYRGGEPHYEVSFETFVKEEKTYARFDIEQVQNVTNVLSLFKMPVWLEVHFEDGTKERKQFLIEKQREILTIEIPNEKRVAFALFDPNSEILSSVKFTKTREMNLAQLLGAEHMLDRYDALKALASAPVEIKRNALIQAFGKEKFYVVKEEIIRQLKDDEHSETEALIRKAAKDPDSKVRQAVANIFTPVPEGYRTLVEELLQDPSYYTIASALKNLCSSFPENTARYLDLTKNETGMRGKNIRMRWLEIAWLKDRDSKHIEELIAYIGPEYEYFTRINAANTLKTLNYFNEKALYALADGVLHKNQRLSRSLGNVLQHFAQQADFKEMCKTFYDAKGWTKREEEVLKRFMF